MLSTNVLCMKKRKKRSYYVSNVSDYGGTKYRNKRSIASGVGMMEITEDTPPDMLAGAMDLVVHLPDGSATKMSVERSTPMMDVLVQITNANHLQISGYVLQPLAMHASPGCGAKVLPYFPNTPIGTLDTQDIRVVAKNRGSATLQRGAAPAQPFESTFRLKVHLPRNQLYVERVSMQARLRDIMAKLCEEKNLDRSKYEFRHPSNLDQVLDLKLRLVDYQITEVYAVSKGSNRLTQVFSSSDSIMAFRKDDNRKQKSNGGGIFNFLKRGKVSNGSGSLSSDNRSISPAHSDDSRSVSPPAGGAKLTTPADKPKPPMRKRRPAPKPPSLSNLSNIDTDEKKSDEDDLGVGVQMRKKDGLTICHSRNSSDSSGYHEASILSDNANTSLPRKRPQSVAASSNLQAMKPQSKSTSSLAFANRLKKKAAPPPPPAMKSARSVAHLENASPVVASPANDASAPDEEIKQRQALNQTNTPCTRVTTTEVAETDAGNDHGLEKEFTNYFYRRRVKNIPCNEPVQSREPRQDVAPPHDHNTTMTTPLKSRSIDNLNEEDHEVMCDKLLKKSMSGSFCDYMDEIDCRDVETPADWNTTLKRLSVNSTTADLTFSSLSETSDGISDEEVVGVPPDTPLVLENAVYSSSFDFNASAVRTDMDLSVGRNEDHALLQMFQRQTSSGRVLGISQGRDCLSLSAIDENRESDITKPKIVGVLMKKTKNGMRKYSSTGDISKCEDGTSPNGVDLYTTLYLCSNYTLTTSADAANARKNEDSSPPESLASSLATTLSSNIETDIGNNIRDEITEEEGDELELQPENIVPKTSEACKKTAEVMNIEATNFNKVEIVKAEERTPEIVIKLKDRVTEIPEKIENSETELKNSDNQSMPIGEEEELRIDTNCENSNDNLIPSPPIIDTTDWEYQLPSPPTAFRDSSPHPDTTTSEESEILHPGTDSILSSPELFEKLNVIKETQSQMTESEALSTKSVDSEEDKFISKLSLENLEIRKKLVYNRELATSLKYQEQDADEVAMRRSSVMSELEDVLKPVNGHREEHSAITPTTLETNKNWNNIKAAVENFSSSTRNDRALPNFKITTYDIPKKKINIFEDDSIRSNVTMPMTSTVGGSGGEIADDEKSAFTRKSRPARQEYNKNRCLTLNRQFLQRSESFNTWTPTAPVKRSKSQVAVKPEVTQRIVDDVVGEETKSKSTLDLTGLQSLEVMKAIRTTLTSTPPTNTTSKTTSTPDEVDLCAIPTQHGTIKPVPPPERAVTLRPATMYSTPSVNFAPWKERKSSVEVKTTPIPHPPKLNSVTNLNCNNSVITQVNQMITSGTTVNLQSTNSHASHDTMNNVSIKVNGSEAISQQPTGNVLIKIGQTPKPQDALTKRYINHSTAVGYRKPLGNINKIQNARPHSIAIDKFEKQEQFDASRVPIVRAVELKKHAHTNGASVTQIRPDGAANKVNLFENVVLRSAAARKMAGRPNSVNLASNSDQRGQLLESIRNFGGKKGLKAVKV